MSEIAIRAENLGKLYKIGEYQGNYKTLREAIIKTLSSPFRQLRCNAQPSTLNSQSDTFWALKDFSFEVNRGEVVGIIGRNGAGKTTLLRILSRITEPTEGWAEIHGKVGSLLEVGTGFHPELTGRENIYLNGAILGMKKTEIDGKFDEIVAFAEIEKFMDTPVKRYSSGMYVRLAFAVAAHLEPEILLVDEVLAVGDVAFQKKCLGKMGNVAKEGRTVLFVSHNMAAISRLCGKGIWLDKGHPQMIGTAGSVITAYLSAGTEAEGERRWKNPEEPPGNEKIRLRAVRILNSKNEVSSVLEARNPFYTQIEYDLFEPLSDAQVGIWVLTSDGIVVFVGGDKDDPNWQGKQRPPGTYMSTCQIPGMFLNSGSYLLTVGLQTSASEPPLFAEEILKFHIEQTKNPHHSLHGRPPGILSLSLPWKISHVQDNSLS
ncbi:MAG: ABC transporter ATP-binding protein [Promethearchaeota archaeon]